MKFCNQILSTDLKMTGEVMENFCLEFMITFFDRVKMKELIKLLITSMEMKKDVAELDRLMGKTHIIRLS